MTKQFITNTILAVAFGVMMSRLWSTSSESVVFVIATLSGQLWLQIMQRKTMTVAMKPYKLEKFKKEMEKFKKDK